MWFLHASAIIIIIVQNEAAEIQCFKVCIYSLKFCLIEISFLNGSYGKSKKITKIDKNKFNEKKTLKLKL